MAPRDYNALSQTEESLAQIFAEVLNKVSKRERQPEIKVSFYPYAGLNHTIRIRDHKVLVRISDVLESAPADVYHALAHILVAKLFKRHAGDEYERLYRNYAYQSDILAAADEARRQRGRKNLTGPAGRFHDLDGLFTKLNESYFNDTLPRPRLSWSVRRTRRILGHHDSVHEAIVISRSLDAGSVPQYVVEYVLYHEMLHIRHRPVVVDGRRSFHSSAFRADEKCFLYFVEATDWLDRSLRRQ